jgi:Tol biopolymer transport system component
MKRSPKLARFLCLPIILAAAACFIASTTDQRAAAVASNGKIAFTSDRVIYTINPNGSDLLQLTPAGNDFVDRFPSWSPDGAKIAFGRIISPVKSEIYVMNADGSNPTRITNNSFSDSQPLWSPDGTKIAFVSNRDGNDEIYVMNADGSNQTRLTNNADFDFDPEWSPDGTKIVFTSSRDFPGIAGNISNGFEIYLMNADGSNPIRLTNNDSSDAEPSWSPDGTRIAFSSQRDGLPLVYVMNVNGSNQVTITPSTILDSQDPEWSPDGTTIAFASFNRAQANANDMFLMNTDGSNIRGVTVSSLDEHDLAWQPAGSAAPTPTPTPTPSPSPTFTISGTVTGTNGQGLADVTVVLLSDVTGTQVTFTDQSGNYVFNYVGGVSHTIRITPSKSGFVFNPLWAAFVSSVSLSGDQTTSFVGTQSPIPVGQTAILLTQENSQRALALDSVMWMSEPFGVANTNNLSTDQRTRISLFAVNIDLAPGETSSIIEAQAEDSLGQVFPLAIEHFGTVPNFAWLKQVVVKLPDAIANKVEVRVSLKVRGGSLSNQVIVKVKP